MNSNTVVKSVAKQLKYYCDIKRLEDGFDLTSRKATELGHSSPRARPAVHFEGLHDRALKHYFTQPEVRAQLTSLQPAESEERSPRERQIRRSLANTMKKYQFGKTQTPEWFYVYSLGGPRQQALAATQRPASSAKPRKSAVKAGWPAVRNAPPPDVPADERERLVNNASKILLSTGPSDDQPRGQLRAKTAGQRYPLRPVETDWELVHRFGSNWSCYEQPSCVKKPRSDSKRRPLTAKSTWDSHGHRLPSATVKVYSESQTDKLPRRSYLRRPQSSPRPAQQRAVKRTEETKSPPSSHSPTPRPASRQGRRPQQLQGTLVSGDETEEEGAEEVTEGPPAEYQVTVKTGNCIGASTTAAVHLTLYGEKGRSPDLHLASSQHNKVKFQRGKEDLFALHTPSVGRLTKIRIGHDRPELSYAWFLDSLRIQDVSGGQVCDLPCHRWLSGQDEDRHTYCTFILTQGTDADRSNPDPPPEVQARSTETAAKPRQASLPRDTAPGRRPQSRKASGQTGLSGHPPGARPQTRSKGDNTRPQTKGDNPRPQTKGDDTRPQTKGDNPRPQTKGDNTSSQTKGDNTRPQTKGDNPRPQTKGDNTSSQTKGDNTSSQTKGDNTSSQTKGDNTRPQTKGDNTSSQTKGDNTSSQTKGDNTSSQTKGDNTSSQTGVGDSERSRRSQSGQPAVSGQEERGKDRRPKPVEEEDRKVADFLEGYKAGVEAVEQAERQRREAERRQSLGLLSGPSIHDACCRGDLERLSLLLHTFPEMADSTDENGWTPLHLAADRGEVELVKRLTMTAGQNLDVETPTGYTPTHLAARNGHIATIKILNAMGASVDCTTVDRQTPLHLAASAGHLECVRCLMAGGADLTLEDSFGRCPLTLAEQHGQWAVVDLLQRCRHDPATSFAHIHQAGRPKTAAEASMKHKDKDSGQGEGTRPMTSTQRKKVKEEEELEMKREQYEEQHRHMETEGVSFLDLIRQEMEQEP